MKPLVTLALLLLPIAAPTADAFQSRRQPLLDIQAHVKEGRPPAAYVVPGEGTRQRASGTTATNTVFVVPASSYCSMLGTRRDVKDYALYIGMPLAKSVVHGALCVADSLNPSVTWTVGEISGVFATRAGGNMCSLVGEYYYSDTNDDNQMDTFCFYFGADCAEGSYAMLDYECNPL